MARMPKTVMSHLANMQALMEQPAVVPRMEIPNLARRDRRMRRRPQEKFFVKQKPWDIQLCALHPVLPGETLMNMQMQARVLTDPILHQLSGWHMEYYLFYVKHTDLADDDNDTGSVDLSTESEAVVAMHLEGTDPAALRDTTRRDAYYKTALSSIDWGSLVTKTVVKWYFRDSNEPIAGYGNYGRSQRTNMGDIYKARVGDPGWMESVKIEDVNPAENSNLPGVEGFQDVFVPSAWSTHYAQWEAMRQLKMISEDVTFEDYLETWGIKAPREDKKTVRRPELIRYLRNWQYPSNTIDGATGAAASAVSWAVSARADKPRTFDKPGFLAMFAVARPKVFFGNQTSHAAIMLDDPYGWLPAILRENSFTTLVEYDHNEGPLNGVFNSADDYWVDRRDLYIRGGQFVNFVPTDANTTCPIVDLPKIAGADNDINLWYPSDTDANNLFIDSDDSEGKTNVRQDGVVTFDIKTFDFVAMDAT